MSWVLSAAALVVPAFGCGEAFGSAGAAGTGATGGGGAGTGAGGAGATGGTPCHPPGVVDEFDGLVFSLLWSTWGEPLPELSGGRLRLWTGGPENWAGLHTVASFDLRGCAVWVDIPVLLPAGVSASTHVWIASAQTWDPYLEFSAWQEQLEVLMSSGENVTPIAHVPYDPGAHRFWRIRDAGGTTFFEASGDGRQWLSLGQLQSPDWLGDVTLVLMAGAWEAGQPAHAAEIESVDGAP